MVRDERGRVSRGECGVAHGEYGAAVPGVAADDRGAVAERVRGGGVRRASVACAVGGVGGGAEGRAERVVLDVGDGGVCAVCGAADAGAVCGGGGVVRDGIDGETDGGDAAVCAAAAGLLAAGEDAVGSVSCRSSRSVAFRRVGQGKGSIFCAGGGVVWRDHLGAAQWRGDQFVGAAAVGAADGQRGGVVCAVYEEDRVAEWTGGFLSVSGVVAGDGDRGGRDPGGGVGRGDLASAARTVSGRRVVLVFGDVGAGDWIGAGRGPVHGGPVYVSAVDWVVHHAVLERAGPRDGAARTGK